MINLITRKYVGVPTQEEIIQQYNEIVVLTKDIKTLEQVQSIENNNILDIEINYDSVSQCNKSDKIEVIRYEYKNILVYANIQDDEIIYSTFITLYSDDGLQFADCIYNNYDDEIERVAKMGLLKLI
jgi:hypothetical protein